MLVSVRKPSSSPYHWFICRELSCWKEPALEEVASLEVTNEAAARTDVRQVDQWVEQGLQSYSFQVSVCSLVNRAPANVV